MSAAGQANFWKVSKKAQGDHAGALRAFITAFNLSVGNQTARQVCEDLQALRLVAETCLKRFLRQAGERRKEVALRADLAAHSWKRNNS
jgi:hypothetical protein